MSRPLHRGGRIYAAGKTPDRPPYDEVGTPPSEIETCDAAGCDVMFRVGGWHDCGALDGQRLSWHGYRLRQAYGRPWFVPAFDRAIL